MLPEKILENKCSTKVELDKCEAHQGGNRMPERVYAEAEEVRIKQVANGRKSMI